MRRKGAMACAGRGELAARAQLAVQFVGDASDPQRSAALRDQLQRLGFTVHCVHSGPAAIAEFQKTFEPLYTEFEGKIGKENIALLRAEVEKAKKELGRN